ncbi:hypothetical protein SDC9_158153 [bioreactor metagenome]|uniref:Uncharacterized protein n=1 Tax=bioreactor metagenome TaxID=1076179 RepID=A0A645FB68_9ZZZZ
MSVVTDHFVHEGAVQEEQTVRLDRPDDFMKFLRQPKNGEGRELSDFRFIPEVHAPLDHLLHADRTDAGVITAHAIEEKAVHRIVFRQFADHVLEVFPVGGIVTGGPHFGGGPRLGHRVTVGRDPHPVAMMKKFLVAEAAVEVCADFDSLPATAFGDLSEQIVFQGRVAGSELCVVIGAALIAPGMPRQKVDAALLEIVGEFLRIEVFSDVRNDRAGVEIVKKRILDSGHLVAWG